MDELEISGKRFISTRRAAKEYKYHADYIGQLIRGKKLLGRKVGRSWYVELVSLTEYFGKEAQLSEPSQLVAKSVERVEEPIEEVTPQELEPEEVSISEVVVEELVVAPVEVEKSETKINIRTTPEIVEEKNVEIEAVSRDAIHIPIRRPSYTESPRRKTALTYIEDNEPYIPETGGDMRAVATTSVMPQSEEEAVIIEDEMNISESGVIQRVYPAFSIAVLGAIVLAVCMFGSIMVNSKTVIEAGKAASVGYSLQ